MLIMCLKNLNRYVNYKNLNGKFMLMNMLIFRKTLILFVILIDVSLCTAQGYKSGNSNVGNPAFQWPEGIKMAISFTFDDARLSQIDQCIPLLDQYGVKGTFYVSIDNLINRVEAWQQAVKNGHDIGNHTMEHPCARNFGWTGEHALEKYTLSKMEGELDSANQAIEAILGVKPVSFAYPCGQTYVGEGIDTKSYVPLIAAKFETGRTWMDEEPNDPSLCNFFQLTGIKLDGKSFEDVKLIIESAKNTGKWLILAGHETTDADNNDSLTSFLSTIEAICQYAEDPANGIWIDNIHQITSYIKRYRVGKTPAKQ